MKAMLAYRLRLMIGTVLGFGLVGLGAMGFAQFPGQERQVQPPATNLFPTDPLPGNFIAQQPRAEKVEKVAAKGIEDEDVPLPATPSQAVVRVEDGKLIVRQRGYGYQHIAQEVDGQRVHTAQLRSTVSARTFDPADVSVFDMKGNRLQNKAWRDKFKNDVHALVAYDGKLPNPRELALFKDDALLVVLPAGSPGSATYAIPSIPAPPAADLPGVPRRGVFDPVAPPATSTRPGTPRAPRPENEDPISPN